MDQFQSYTPQFAPMRDVEIGERIEKGILVSNLSDEEGFLADLETFIRKVQVFKQLATTQTIGDKLDVLRSDLQNTGRKAGYPGRRRATTVSSYDRDPRITELVKLMANGKCRLCKKIRPFQG